MTLPSGVAQDVTDRVFGGTLIPVETNPTLGGGSEAILGGDPERASWLVINLSPSEVFLSWGNSVSATNGILLPANGGYVSTNVQDDGDLVSLPLFAYTAAAGPQIYIQRTRREQKKLSWE